MEESVRFKPTAGGSFNPLSMYPVGSIYQSVLPTDPSELFGGTWTQLKDRFLLAAGDTYAAGSTGGEAQHTLTQSEIPNYQLGFWPTIVPINHSLWHNGGISGAKMEITGQKIGVTGGEDKRSGDQYGWNINSNGGSQPHNNLPPYLAVYTWVRTA